jgi:hypothetical protein
MSEVILREAAEKDSSSLNDFFFSIPLQGDLELKIRRENNFFSFYNRLGYSYRSVILEQEKKSNQSEVLGTATFIFQRRYLKTFEIKIAFACDLRISPQRQAVLNWIPHFTPQLEKLKTEDHVEHIVTSINLSDQQVVNTFLRPRARRGQRPLYELITKYNLVSIHGFYPLLKKKNPNITSERAQNTDRPLLIKYLRKKFLEFDFVPSEYMNDFEKTVQTSLLYMWNQFIVAKNLDGEIVGCVYPLASTLLQDYFPQNYTSQANNFRQFLKLASLLRFGRKLTKPFSRTQKDETLNFRLLHFFFFDHPEVMNDLLKAAYKDSRQNEFLVYAHQDNQFAYRPPKGSIEVSFPHALYEVKNSDPKLNADPPLKRKVGFPLFLDHLWF